MKYNLIIDESDNLKNKSSLRAKVVRKLAKKIKYKIIMS